ncbi:hypothetical protein ACVNP1_07960 [Staphylococcus aureus]
MHVALYQEVETKLATCIKTFKKYFERKRRQI